ncbi:hypothetical protein [Falsiporphyromonas endometrii]|uniref:Uncharacterized protein n=1 Tax=Falsiporphyromonas endometrii TaxID=1387297 RepID=A0ABV9K6R8_9PORP
MEIIISLTILLMMMLLGALYLQDKRVCPFGSNQFAISARIQISPSNLLLLPAVKLATEGLYSLNIITLSNAPKGAQTNLISIDINTLVD